MKRYLGLAAVLALTACVKTSAKHDDSTQSGGLDASLEMLFAPGQPLAGDPNIFDLTVQRQDPAAKALYRAGDLPAPGQTIVIDKLPSGAAATLVMNLYHAKLTPEAHTHTCRSDAPVALIGGQTTSVSLTCMPLLDPVANQLIQVFLKVAKASISITELDPTAILAQKDFSHAALFAVIDPKGRRVSLKQDEGGLTVYVGGDIAYLMTPDPAQTSSPVQRLLAGETLTLTAITGQMLPISPESATLKLSGAPLLFEQAGGGYGVALAIDLANAAGTITVKGRVLEEPAGSEFTVVSYNVENLFDQEDEARNSGYGDYRLAVNDKGENSNYGEPAMLDGQTMSFTRVKIEGIRKALIGIDPAGPAIVGVVEIESKAVLDQLFDRVKDLGYVAAQYSQPADGPMPTAVGVGLLTKFPIVEWSLIQPVNPPLPQAEVEALRAILKVKLDVNGQSLLVYVNHWKSKSGPEVQRIACAEALERDLEQVLAADPRTDYVVVGDLNSDYNEVLNVVATTADPVPKSGINTVLRSQGDELKVLKAVDPTLKYDLLYELDRGARRTAYEGSFGWGTLDHIIVGSGLYDQKGLTYVDDSFQVATTLMPRLSFLFNPDGSSHRWQESHEGKFTRHTVGGYSDHLPLFARLRIAPRQSPGTIRLGTPGKPDATDPK